MPTTDENKLDMLHRTVIQTDMNVDSLMRSVESLFKGCKNLQRIQKCQLEQIGNLIQRVTELEEIVEDYQTR